ncbi:hypothetical protein, partial [Paenibacillus odorifer]|uniref:hypothetical protein n=1 Tax=Paenibacillus odorifer TaxID=189426 RepID=UPI001C4CE131
CSIKMLPIQRQVFIISPVYYMGSISKRIDSHALLDLRVQALQDHTSPSAFPWFHYLLLFRFLYPQGQIPIENTP